MFETHTPYPLERFLFLIKNAPHKKWINSDFLKDFANYSVAMGTQVPGNLASRHVNKVRLTFGWSDFSAYLEANPFTDDQKEAIGSLLVKHKLSA